MSDPPQRSEVPATDVTATGTPDSVSPAPLVPTHVCVTRPADREGHPGPRRIDRSDGAARSAREADEPGVQRFVAPRGDPAGSLTLPRERLRLGPFGLSAFASREVEIRGLGSDRVERARFESARTLSPESVDPDSTRPPIGKPFGLDESAIQVSLDRLHAAMSEARFGLTTVAACDHLVWCPPRAGTRRNLRADGRDHPPLQFDA